MDTGETSAPGLQMPKSLEGFELGISADMFLS